MDFVPVSFPAPDVSSTKAHGSAVEGLEGSIHLIENRIVFWREAVELTQGSIDERFRRFADLTGDLETFAWIWDVAETNPPAPSALVHFRSCAEAFGGRVSHLAVRTGANVGLWLNLRHLLPQAGFTSVSVHRSIPTALERARRG